MDLSLKISPIGQQLFMKELVKRVDEVVTPAKLSRAAKAGAKFMAGKIKEGYKSNNFKVNNTTLSLRKASTARSALYDTGELMRAVQERKGQQTKNTSNWYVGFKEGTHAPGAFGGKGIKYGRLAGILEEGNDKSSLGKPIGKKPMWDTVIKRNALKMREVIEKELGQ